MNKAIFAPESSREFQKRLNDLINAAENLNNKTMENEELFKGIVDYANKELEKLKALGKSEIPEYVEITSCYSGMSWYKGKIGEIFKTNGIYEKEYYSTPHSTYIIEIKECKPSTKEAFDKQNEIILVPDCIKFENIYKGLGIVFNDNKQTLWLQSDFYSVARSHKIHIKDGSNFKLTKCERSDLKAGDVALMTDGDDNVKTYYDDILYYCIILKNDECVCIDDKDCIVSDDYYDTWYKVEKI